MAHGPNYGWSVTFLITATNSCGSTAIEAYVTCAPPPACDEKPSLISSSENNYTLFRILPPCDNSYSFKSESLNIKEIEIYDLTGIKIGIFSSISIDNTMLKKGIYLVKAYTEEGIFTNKIKID